MTAPASDFHDDETTTGYRDETTLCGATPTCSEPGAFSDANGHAACRTHGGVAPRNLPPDVRRLVASAATRRDYGAIARLLGDADVDLAWLAKELTQTERPRAHALAVDLVRLGVEPHLLVPSLPPATVNASPRVQLRRDRMAKAVCAGHRICKHCAQCVDHLCQEAPSAPNLVPDELRECYRRHGEAVAERDALRLRVAELETLAEERLAWAHQLQADLDAEQRGRQALRQRLGAREDESFPVFVERIYEGYSRGMIDARTAYAQVWCDVTRRRIEAVQFTTEAFREWLRELLSYDHFADM